MKPAGIIPTVRIVNPKGGTMLINAEDFDSKKHKLAAGEKEPVSGTTKPPEPPQFNADMTKPELLALAKSEYKLDLNERASKADILAELQKAEEARNKV